MDVFVGSFDFDIDEKAVLDMLSEHVDVDLLSDKLSLASKKLKGHLDNNNNDNDNNNEFRAPICYSRDVHYLDPQLVADLELTAADQEGEGVYSKLLLPRSEWARGVLPMLTETYTEDVAFLKDTQKLLQLKEVGGLVMGAEEVGAVDNTWNEIRNNPKFLYTFNYVEWPILKFLNESEYFLLFSSMYHLSSPVLALLLPVIVLIMPFFILLQMDSVKIGFSEYLEVLMQVMEHHAVGRIFTQFHDVNLEEKAYLIVSVFFYLFSFYQNIVVCLTFHSNLQRVHDHIASLGSYLEGCERRMRAFAELCASNDLKSYEPFLVSLRRFTEDAASYKLQLQSISAYCLSVKKMAELGQVLKLFYALYANKGIEDLFYYTFGFNGYVELVGQLHARVESGKMSLVSSFFDDEGAAETEFSELYYPGIVDEDVVVSNSVGLKDSIILTGPNASGKTTLLKATLINTLLAQQFGAGCFASAKVAVVAQFHCYLNIADTMGRDSLFQTESKRCQTIIQAINKNKNKNKNNKNNENKRHLCVFDELFSGTNPVEAVKCAYGFLVYLSKYPNVRFLLTTHYLDICKMVETKEVPCIANFKMKVVVHEKKLEGGGEGSEQDAKGGEEEALLLDVDVVDKILKEFEYTYGLERGINPIDGGIEILRQLDYPQEILSTISEL